MGHIQRAAERKDDREGEGRERVVEGSRGEEKERLTHAVLAPDKMLLPGFNKTVSPHTTHPPTCPKKQASLFKMKTTKVKEMCKQERKGRHGWEGEKRWSSAKATRLC